VEPFFLQQRSLRTTHGWTSEFAFVPCPPPNHIRARDSGLSSSSLAAFSMVVRLGG
jgi:hypothetical protein